MEQSNIHSVIMLSFFKISQTKTPKNVSNKNMSNNDLLPSFGERIKPHSTETAVYRYKGKSSPQ